MPSDPSRRTRDTQTVEPGFSLCVRRASACASGAGKGEGPLDEATRAPSLRRPTAPRRKARPSDLRRLTPAAMRSMSASEVERM